MTTDYCPRRREAYRTLWDGLVLDDPHARLRVWCRRVVRVLRAVDHDHARRCALCNPRGNPPAAPHTHGYRAKARRRSRR